MLKYPQNRPKTGVLGRFDPFLGYIASKGVKMTPFWAHMLKMGSKDYRFSLKPVKTPLLGHIPQIEGIWLKRAQKGVILDPFLDPLFDPF